MTTITKSDDGHQMLDGARWHVPATGNPSACAVKGCTRVLTRHLKNTELGAPDDAGEAADENVAGASNSARSALAPASSSASATQGAQA